MTISYLDRLHRGHFLQDSTKLSGACRGTRSCITLIVFTCSMSRRGRDDRGHAFIRPSYRCRGAWCVYLMCAANDTLRRLIAAPVEKESKGSKHTQTQDTHSGGCCGRCIIM